MFSQPLDSILCWTLVGVGLVYLLVLAIIQSRLLKNKPDKFKANSYSLNHKLNWHKIKWFCLYFLGITIICVGLIINYGRIVI